MMHSVRLAEGADLEGFRSALRGLVAAGIPPEHVVWEIGGEGLFGEEVPFAGPPVPLSRPLAGLVTEAVRHRDPERYALLYHLVWRYLHGEPHVLEMASDPLVHRLLAMAKAVRRDLHKMHAFLRFRRVEALDGAERFAAWFEPQHHILDAAAPFFVERFPSMDWTIVTPLGTLHWDGTTLERGPAGTRAGVPDADAVEAGWRGYYESTFNPARVNPAMMRAEMPKRYWRNMPEAAAIPGLVRTASSRVREMMEREATMQTKRTPERALLARSAEPRSLEELNTLIAASEPLVPGATRAVLGEGPNDPAIAFVGEQPGDQEDREGRPFVGPAGQLLDRAMAAAGIDRSTAYVTNAVKHFKFVQRGKRRIHQKPTAGEIKHYRWWLEKELQLVNPRVVVALGGTATQALLGKAVPVSQVRGEIELAGHPGYVTVHPSSILRQPDAAAKEAAYESFLADLRRIAMLVRHTQAA